MTMHLLTIRNSGSFRLLVLLPAALLVLLGWTAADESIAQLRLDHAALRAAEDDYREQRMIGLDGLEAAEYAGYIARLQRRVFEDCRAVVESGSSLPPDLPCPVNIPQATRSADIETEQEQTAQEQIAALDTMLNAGLGQFDEELLREQERIKANTPNSNDGSGAGSGNGSGEGSDGGADGGSDGEGSEGEGQQGESGDRSADGSDQSDGQSGDNQRQGNPSDSRGPRDSSDGSGDQGSDSDTPEDIPDGSDDDVVARQLREAAEKETDPELKAKLWEEYRRYKRGTN